ncbi:hypothetical protein BH09VER1_BH09VER1_51590 [soil metagenome]
MIARRTTGGFSLIELFVALAIVSCLAGLLMPVVSNLRKRAEVAACASNLRQIGVAGLLYSADNNQKLPMIEPWPSQPLYSPEDGVKNILEVLGPYGLTRQALICRSDIAGPNYNATEGSSYEWCPIANGQNIQSAKLGWGNMTEGISLSKLLVAFDYSNIHGDRSNVLFGDGHVAGATGN